MHSYLIRIELQNPMLLDYTTLHKAMANAGFRRTIFADNGVEYHLPNAEYVIATASQLSQVVQSAKSCANLTGKISTVFGVKFVQWSGDGVLPVKK